MTQTTPFIVGQIVKLKNYFPYNDWESHKNQTARITKINQTAFNEDLDRVELKWKDDITSFSPSDNLILVINNERIKKLKEKLQ